MLRRVVMTGLVLGLLTASATSRALTLYHSSETDGSNPETLPLRITAGAPDNANLTLWMDSTDPNEATILALVMQVKSPGVWTLSFACDLGFFCETAGALDPNGVMGLASINPGGWVVPKKIGDFTLINDGAPGDKINLVSGSYTTSLDQERSFTPTTLAVVRSCGDAVLDPGEVCDGNIRYIDIF